MQQAAWTAVVVLGAMTLGGYLFVCFYRVVEGGLRETRRHLRAMADGDLTTSPAPWGHDEAAHLMLELQTMQAALRRMVLRVRCTSDTIVLSSREIAVSARDLAARTELAAANLQESSASMEDIASAVRLTARHAHEASQTARRNAQAAAAGGQAMHDVVQTMRGIQASSTQIADIISTMDRIALQTSILALNASVEANRSGEQGRSFAVVAHEVRALARHSTLAARDIGRLIHGSVQQVQAGTCVAREAAGPIGEIVTTSEQVDQLLSEVAAGAQAQSIGVDQVEQAVKQLDRMTQQNAVLVEQTAAAACALKTQADILASEVACFRIAEAPLASVRHGAS